MLGNLFKKITSSAEDESPRHHGEPDSSKVNRAIKKLEIKAQKLAQQRLLGRYRSRFKGRGLDFRDFREYLAGDDTRSIDWNVTARFGRPFVKNTEEERELSVIVALDVSPSQTFGSGEQTKRELASELATLMVLTALASGDKVGFLITDGQRGHYITPSKGRHQKHRILQSIWRPLEEQKHTVATDLFKGLEDLSRQLRRRGFICLISDLIEPVMMEGASHPDSEKLLSLLRQLSYRHEVIALRTLDGRERDIPKVGVVTLRDQTDGRTVQIDTDHPDWAGAFQARWQEWDQNLSRLMKRARWDWQEFFTDSDPVPVLANFLDARGRR